MPPAIGDGEQTSRRRDYRWIIMSHHGHLNKMTKLEQIINQLYVVTCYTSIIYLSMHTVWKKISFVNDCIFLFRFITTEVTILLKLIHGSTWMVLSQNDVQSLYYMHRIQRLCPFDWLLSCIAAPRVLFFVGWDNGPLPYLTIICSISIFFHLPHIFGFSKSLGIFFQFLGSLASTHTGH